MHTKTDLAYAAGIIDGEGTIGLTQYWERKVGREPAQRIRPYMAVSMTDPGIPLWFQEMFGGTIQLISQRQSHHRRLTRWTVSGKKCSPICESLLPYLRLKGRQAVLVVEFSERCQSWTSRSIPIDELALREAALTEIHELNRRGVLIRGA